MQVEYNVNDFFSYNDIAVFPAKMAKEFTTFNALVASYPKINLDDNDVVYASVTSNFPLSYFNNIDSVRGIAVVDPRLLRMTYLSSNNLTVKAALIRAILSTLTEELYCYLPIDSLDFTSDVGFLVKQGFINPTYDESSRSIVLSYARQESSAVTLANVEKIVSSVKRDRCSLRIIIPTYVAATMSKTVRFMNEAAGTLYISRYTDAGEAILSINSNDIHESDSTSQVTLPYTSLFSFHSHPDHITHELKVFIAWPSGQDMRTIIHSYLVGSPQLVHMVASPEGLWVVTVPFTFQKYLVNIKDSECIDTLLNAVYTAFTRYDYERSEITNPIERHAIERAYLSHVSAYKLSTLLAEYPIIVQKCGTITYDTPLFKVSVIKWKQFEEGHAQITVEWLPANPLPLVLPTK